MSISGTDTANTASVFRTRSRIPGAGSGTAIQTRLYGIAGPTGSSKTLTNLIRSISGQSARDWIVYFIILEMKSRLRQSSMDLKSIAARMKFPDQTNMSRFFRRYTGMTPSKYRDSIHF